MNEQHDIRSQNETQFREIALQILEQAGFEEYKPEEKFLESQDAPVILKKDENIYWLETFYSRREQYTSRAVVNVMKESIQQIKDKQYLPLIVVGGVVPSGLQAEILGVSIRAVILDIRHLLHIVDSEKENHELYVDLIANLPYSPDGLKPKEPDYLPLPDWNSAYAGKSDWEITVSSFRPNKPDDFADTLVPPPMPESDGNGEGDLFRAAGKETHVKRIEPASEEIFDWEEYFNGQVVPGSAAEDPYVSVSDIIGNEPSAMDAEKERTPLAPLSVSKPKSQRTRTTRYGIDLGTSYSATMNSFLYLENEAKKLKKDIQSWQGGKQTNAAAYEKLCTRTLMRIFADDLTLWREQAKSNSDLFRFDLICKIKRDNHKDFWEMAERYFGSKYIIFEFKNYSGKVTQKEVYTTVRYLYTKAMRGIAIIISPNGMDDNGGKACRGVLRDEGKLILSLTNDDLLEMLRMKEDGEDPADFLSDKLDELLIDLEK